jgi:NAD(P)-dependent dehydrogenase (short-subunit alcohol dehydrogenase family)
VLDLNGTSSLVTGGASGLGEAAARQLAAAGIRLNCVAPGLIDTPIYGEGEASEAFKDQLKRDVNFPKRLGTADELASMILELLVNTYANGETVRLDGGARLQPK